MSISFNEVALQIGQATEIAPISRALKVRSVVVIGGVGSGKTLLARALAGERLDVPDVKLSGTVQLGDDDIDLRLPPNKRVRLGYVPQIASSFFIAASVLDEIKAMAYCSATSEWDSRRIIAAWMKSSPLRPQSDLSPFALSGGQQRLLMLETVIASDPDHLLLDGADVALDHVYREYASNLIRAWIDNDPRRRLVSFATNDRNPLLKDSGFLTLGSIKPSPVEQPTRKAQLRNAKVLEFREIVGGPRLPDGPLLQGINLSVREGEFVGLVGRNGVGKSTLVSFVAGVTMPQKGDVYFQETRLADVEWPGLSGGVLFLPQEPELAALPLVRPGLGMASSIGMPRLGWDGSLAGYWTMSSGERALLALEAQASQGPRMWILDEPTSRMPGATLAGMVSRYRSRNPRLSGLIISHDSSLLEHICDRQVELRRDGIVPAPRP